MAKKRSQYDKIDPVVSREIFIRTALVEQELGANESFLQVNRKLIEEVQDLENKARRRDILVDEHTLYEFYDKHIPADVCNRVSFLKWYKEQKRKDKRFLHMSKEALMRHGADEITADNYPDIWMQGNLVLPLSYSFEPGQDVDGVAVQIPLALLNQVQNEGFDWHIPAFRHELICALIKSLPKAQRRNFVPAPNYADAVLSSVEPLQGKLVDALALRLFRMTGAKVEAEQFDPLAVDEHLRMAFEVRDDRNTLVARGYDLDALKAQLADKVSNTLSQVADEGIERQGLTEWQFEALPESYVKKQGQYEVKAFVALVDKKDSTAIELFDSPTKAQAAHQQGLRRMVLLNIPSPIKYLQQNLPNKA